jgi:protein tyrosine phosphatase (PTP) superfamily phosphohydrolase (DUF442 family)
MLSEIFNFYEFSPTLASSGMPTRDQFGDIQTAGFTVVIDLSLNESKNHLPDEAELVSSLGMQYIHIPVVWDSPQLTDLEHFFQVMQENQGRKVFVHCVANYRATAFIYLFRILCQHEPDEAAYRDLTRIWTPQGVWEEFIHNALEKAKK